jgi:hypothetical protein
MISRAHKVLLLTLLALPATAAAGEPAASIATSASLVNPHTKNLELDFHAKRRGRRAGNFEPSNLLDLSAGLQPLNWPRNSDMRARVLTPELKRTPLVGWIAANLYRSRKEDGWCLEVDPGEGEYLVFYRINL